MINLGTWGGGGRYHIETISHVWSCNSFRDSIMLKHACMHGEKFSCAGLHAIGLGMVQYNGTSLSYSK